MNGERNRRSFGRFMLETGLVQIFCSNSEDHTYHYDLVANDFDVRPSKMLESDDAC